MVNSGKKQGALGRVALLGIGAMLIASNSFAKTRMPINSTSKCEKQITEKLTELKSNEAWIRISDTKAGHKTFRSTTQVFGEWVEVVIGKSPTLYLVTPKGIKEFSWNTQTCDMSVSSAFEIDSNYINVSGPAFTDVDLKSFLDKKENVIIYTYSPKMTYSIKYMEKMSEVAKKLGYKFIPILDPTIKIEEAAPLVPKKLNIKVQKSASVEILMRQMLTHFPASLVLHNGKILDPFIFGVMSKEEFEQQIMERVMRTSGVSK